MHDTAPPGAVTNSPLGERHEHDQQHDSERDERQAADAAGRAVPGPLRERVLPATNLDGSLGIGHERTEREEPAAVKGQAGDVDGNGDVVDELQRRLRRKVAAARLIFAVGDAPARARVLDEADALLGELIAALDATYVPLSRGPR